MARPGRECHRLLGDGSRREVAAGVVGPHPLQGLTASPRQMTLADAPWTVTDTRHCDMLKGAWTTANIVKGSVSTGRGCCGRFGRSGGGSVSTTGATPGW